MSGRRAARRTALFLLYQWDVTGQPLASLYEGEVDEYARATAEAVAARAAELDRRITDASEEWTANRLGAIERNVLRIAERLQRAEELSRRVGELRARVDTAQDPNEVAELMNELAELARETQQVIEDAQRRANEESR